MNSSAQPSRRIASNLLWTSGGIVRNPLLTLDSGGRVVAVETCPEPDRLAATEFYAGLLVPGFPSDCRTAFERLCRDSAALAQTVTPGGVLVVISGLDYESLRLTPRSQIRRL